jgi:hypothetical protein
LLEKAGLPDTYRDEYPRLLEKAGLPDSYWDE